MLLNENKMYFLFFLLVSELWCCISVACFPLLQFLIICHKQNLGACEVKKCFK